MSAKLQQLLQESRVLEIVEETAGELWLQVRENDEPVHLLRLEVSDDMRDLMGEAYLEMARTVLTAGAQVLTEFMAEQLAEEEDEVPSLLH
ncbi:hypothetical protein [Balneatrix alpica]|uniref:Uncharacterized protein n=1 Tax=Balneatrix alpica TaxID=75684 RepID=A0ABV5Z9X5_9GAMM|nr:hypothetical protein [Balneatrix alpica]